MWLILLKIYILLLAGVSVISITRYKVVDTSAKFIVALLLLTSFSETVAYYISITTKNNLFIYHIYSPIQLLLLSIFYNYTITFFKPKNIGLLIGVTGVIASILFSILFQNPTSSLNTYFLVLESLLIIGMTLCYFYDFLNTTHTTKQFTTPNFWIACILLIYWSFTFFRWSVGVAIPSISLENTKWINYMMYFINMVTYTGFGLVFLFYRKLLPK